MSEEKSMDKELREELREEPGLTVAPPQLTLQEEPIPNPAVEAMVDNQKKQEK